MILVSPDNADKKWRQEATEKWIKQLSQNSESKNACLLGQMVPAEIVSSPSAVALKNIHIILLDCQDETRILRLKKHNRHGIDQNTLNWASWLRLHCKDPSWEQHVIKNDSSALMCFEQWNSLQSWDGIASIEIIDTTQLSIDSVAEQISNYIQFQRLGIRVRQLCEDDIKSLSNAFLKEHYHKTPELFERYLQEQNDLKRSVYVAIDIKNHYLGYITIFWKSSYTYFAENNIPEINDFNVLPSKQGHGIGTHLIEYVETIAAKKCDQIGLGVGLFKDYGAAFSLYIKRGYIPNKEGITYKLKTVKPFTSYPIDDDCLLWLTKKIGRNLK